MRYFLELQYNGTAYYGWQRQPQQVSVQGTLEKALSTLLREDILVTGAGRTDTGVHTSYYVAHFDCSSPIENQEQFLYKINRILPFDITILSITKVAEEAHARFNALEREYCYYLSPFKDPFTRPLTWQYFYPLDVEKMNQAASYLLQEQDFTSFAKLNSNNKTNICHIQFAHWSMDDRGVLCFRIRADRFLRNMVRAIVGTLVDVGRGRYSPEEFHEIILSRDLSRSSGGAPASGLFLSDVLYPATVFQRK